MNQPGTDKEYPNWQLPLGDEDGQPVLLEELGALAPGPRPGPGRRDRLTPAQAAGRLRAAWARTARTTVSRFSLTSRTSDGGMSGPSPGRRARPGCGRRGPGSRAATGNSPTTIFCAESLVRVRQAGEDRVEVLLDERLQQRSVSCTRPKPRIAASCSAFGRSSLSTTLFQAASLASAVGIAARAAAACRCPAAVLSRSSSASISAGAAAPAATSAVSSAQRRSVSIARPRQLLLALEQVAHVRRVRGVGGRPGVRRRAAAAARRCRLRPRRVSSRSRAVMARRQRGPAGRVGVEARRRCHLGEQHALHARVRLGRNVVQHQLDEVAARPSRRHGSCPRTRRGSRRGASRTSNAPRWLDRGRQRRAGPAGSWRRRGRRR